MSAQHSRRRSRRLALLLDLDPAAGRTPAERLGLELRARANASGRCVCGAVGSLRPHAAFPDAFQLLFVHEHDCPVLADGDAPRGGGEGRTK